MAIITNAVVDVVYLMCINYSQYSVDSIMFVATIVEGFVNCNNQSSSNKLPYIQGPSCHTHSRMLTLYC